MYLVHTFYPKYVLGTYIFSRVCTSMYQVQTDLKCLFLSMYSRKKVCTGYILQGHKMVCTGIYRVHTGTSLFQCFGTSFISFLKGTSVHILVCFLSTYLVVPDRFRADPAQPVCLQAIHALQHAFNQSTLKQL